MKTTIGIIGNGFVGQATKLLECDTINVLMYDIVPEKCNPPLLSLDKMILESEIIMLCVPTPMKTNGECETMIVESCVNDIRNSPSYQQNQPHIVVRSTVPVGFCKSLGVCHMPEFLTEATWENDFKNCELWIIGIYEKDTEIISSFKKLIQSIIQDAKMYAKITYSNIRFVDTNTSEFVKYGRNCFLAAKLSICNEYYAFCNKLDIDYDNAINLIGEDKRIGKRYTKVPGQDGKCGWSGTCFPKDTMSFLHQFKKNGVDNYMIQASVNRNNNVDRPEKDWNKKENKGRTFI